METILGIMFLTTILLVLPLFPQTSTSLLLLLRLTMPLPISMITETALPRALLIAQTWENIISTST